MDRHFIIEKKLGETPLEALERFRMSKIEEVKSCNEVGKCDENMLDIKYWQDVPMTYAGRLDPMAEGKLIILVGQECKNKDKYLGLDKEYEVEVLFGIDTDTHDILGLAEADTLSFESIQEKVNSIVLDSFAGKFEQEYPAYSSKTVDGRQLHELARAGELPEEMPTKNVEIYSIDKLDIYTISCDVLRDKIDKSIDLIKGDFRQDKIKETWKELFYKGLHQKYMVMRIRVKCSSGTYMRILAKNIGKSIGMRSCALSINRTKFLGIDAYDTMNI